MCPCSRCFYNVTMFSNIYVSFAAPSEDPADDSAHGYRKVQHTWMVTVEPKAHNLPLVPHKNAQEVHFALVEHEDGGYHSQERTASGVLGAILIAHDAHYDVNHMRKLLCNSASVTLPDEEIPDLDSDRWLRRILRILQVEEVIGRFRVDEFMDFAHSYAAVRTAEAGNAPAIVVAPFLQKDHKQSQAQVQHHGFFSSHPAATNQSHGSSHARNHVNGIK